MLQLSYKIPQRKLYYELGDMDSAKEIFEDLLGLIDWPDITEEARIYLGRINAPDGIF
jgi:hypothetical protein